MECGRYPIQDLHIFNLFTDTYREYPHSITMKNKTDEEYMNKNCQFVMKNPVINNIEPENFVNVP